MKKINVGMIGCGKISELHILEYMDSQDANLCAFADLDETLLSEKKKLFPRAKLYKDYKEILNDKNIDAVEIITPQKLHEKMIMEALNAEKHIMCQKPMTTDIESAQRIIKAVEKHNVVFKVIENYMFYPPIVELKRIIDSKEIGEAISMRIKFISGSKGGWFVPVSTWGWRMIENSEGRGMQTFDHGHHMWALASHLLGKVDKVHAWIDSYDGVVDCPSIISWKYKDGIKYGVCDYTHCPDMEMPSDYYACDEWLEVVGTKGLALIKRCTSKLLEGAVLSVYNGKWTHYENMEDDWSSGFKNATKNFINAIKGIEKPALTVYEAYDILKMALAIIKSSKEFREVFVDEIDNENPDEYSKKRLEEEKRKAKEGRKAITIEELKNKKIL